MTTQQVTMFAILGGALALFAWNRWRCDLVALLALLAAALTGLVPSETVFSGLGHPAVVTVAAVLVMSRGLVNAGVVDMIARYLTRAGDRPFMQVLTLTAVVTLFSGFMNNVGALALLMPVAVWMSRRSGRSPGILLMPLAFGSLLGGMLTMIGTPPNIIIASFRQETGVAPFGMFDFLPVGAPVAAVGLVFITVIGWRLTPKRSRQSSPDELFEVSAYLTELRVPENCKFAGKPLHDLLAEVRDEADVMILALVRDQSLKKMPSMYDVLREQDTLLVEADSDSLKTLLDLSGLRLAAEEDQEQEEKQKEEEEPSKDEEEHAGPSKKELSLVEVIITAGSVLSGTTLSRLDLRDRYGVNVLAVARQGHRLHEQLGKIRFVPGDILLVQGDEEQLPSRLNTLGCLPLASRGLRIGKPRKVLLACTIFGAALVAIALNLMPAATALVAAAVVMVLVKLISPGEIYTSIDMPVIVLLAALIPVGQAMETTGGSELIAGQLLRFGQSASPAQTLILMMGSVMLLSNVINNAAAALLAAPVAANLAAGMGVLADPFLMAVAVGASCAFLTPIGHQSNMLVMAPGGYRFGDYWKMGLPLSLLVIGASVPLILWRWPLHLP